MTEKMGTEVFEGYVLIVADESGCRNEDCTATHAYLCDALNQGYVPGPLSTGFWPFGHRMPPLKDVEGCLMDLVGKRVRVTIEVLEMPPLEEEVQFVEQLPLGITPELEEMHRAKVLDGTYFQDEGA